MEKTEKLKTKVRFTSLDVAAMVENLQALIGMRATNIYDLNPSTYLIKMAKSEDKSYLLIQNGVRFHTCDQKPDKKRIPSGFTMKFRKFLRSKRLQSIRQVGVERVVVFTFGSQAFANHLILQLYAQGNIILTDNNYRILQCIRSHEFNQKVKTAVGQIYPFEYAANIYLENLIINEQKIDEFFSKDEKNEQQQAQNVEQTKGKSKKANKKAGNVKVKDVVFKMIPCLFPLVIQHILLLNNKNPEQKVTKQSKQIILQCGTICLQFLKTYLKSKHSGYLFEKQYKQQAHKKQQKKDKEYFEFSSYKNAKYLQQPVKEFPTFDAAVAEYFANYKLTSHQEEQDFEGLAWKKYDQIKRDQDDRVLKLQQQQDLYKTKAEYIEKNIHDVDAIIKIVKTMQDNGYSWDDIKRMVSESKKNGDPLANMIHDMDILKRQVRILLGDTTEGQQMSELLPVQINIDYNAYTNATLYYESKKKNYQKQKRTKEASQQVLKLAQKDALKKIQKKKNQYFAKNLPQRKTFWFEKFNWFISSEGYLVISGRDSHQNELVVKRYMKSWDIYMHSDYGGAASTVIKRHRKDIPVPTTTLQEAAVFTVCRSKAWQTKIMSGAWWVYPQQVSKSAPTGEFLPTGSFMIRGKRNFIQPNRMQMGLTLLFKVDNQSAQRHLNDRRVHEQQLKKEQQEGRRQFIQGDDKQQEEFAIVSIDTQTRKQKQEEMKKLKQKNKNPQLIAKSSKIQQAKEQPQVQKNKSENGSDDQSEDSDDQNNVKPTLTKKASQVKKPQKSAKEIAKQQAQPKQQKHKQRNKKKLKKLQKYLQQQDQDQREIIMKMLGAKQMKHMKDSDDAEQEEVKNQDKKKKKKQKRLATKKGMGKYFDMDQQDEEKKQKLNPDKVLFLKDKKKQIEEDKKLLENSDDSDQEQQKDKKKKADKNKTNTKKQVKSEAKNQTQKSVTITPVTETIKTQTQPTQISKTQQNAENSTEQALESIQQENQQQNQHSQVSEQDSGPQQAEQQNKEQVKEEIQEQIDQKILDTELGQLYKLVGVPHPEDKFQFFVAMCAPYSSIAANKYKIKLVPGGLKKGKAARAILQYFMHGSEQLTQQQKIMLKSLPEQQVINAVIGNVKMAGAGLLKMQMKEKLQKKLKRKEEDRMKQKKDQS